MKPTGHKGPKGGGKKPVGPLPPIMPKGPFGGDKDPGYWPDTGGE